MPDRFPGYNVLSKRLSPSWNAKTREVIDRRLARSTEPQFFTPKEYAQVVAIADRIVPQPKNRPPVHVAALVDHQLELDQGDGYRHAGVPLHREAWRRGLHALNVEAEQAYGRPFEELDTTEKDVLLTRMRAGELKDSAWGGMPSSTFFSARMAQDIVRAYYAHPTAWSEVGWGGPASPRGYVRMGPDKRDPWEAAEVRDGDVETAKRKNHRVG